MRQQIAFKSSMHMLDVVRTENLNPDVAMAAEDRM